MTKDDLRQIRGNIKFDMRSMAACLGIPCSTYQRYEDGSAKIPDTVARHATELVHIEAELDRQRIGNYEAWLAQQPYFTSEVVHEC